MKTLTVICLVFGYLAIYSLATLYSKIDSHKPNSVDLILTASAFAFFWVVLTICVARMYVLKQHAKVNLWPAEHDLYKTATNHLSKILCDQVETGNLTVESLKTNPHLLTIIDGYVMFRGKGGEKLQLSHHFTNLIDRTKILNKQEM